MLLSLILVYICFIFLVLMLITYMLAQCVFPCTCIRCVFTECAMHNFNCDGCIIDIVIILLYLMTHCWYIFKPRKTTLLIPLLPVFTIVLTQTCRPNCLILSTCVVKLLNLCSISHWSYASNYIYIQ